MFVLELRLVINFYPAMVIFCWGLTTFRICLLLLLFWSEK